MAIATRTELKKFIYERYQYHKQKKLAELAEETTSPTTDKTKQQYITIPRWMVEQEQEPKP